MNIGISDQVGELTLYGTGEAGSFDPSSKFIEGSKGVSVPVDTLSNVCDKYVPEGTDIHFLKIDVEGWEKNVLKGMNFKKYHPWIIVIESLDQGTRKPVWEEWEGIILKSGYSFAGMYGVNRYYVYSDRKELLPRFNDLESIKNKYDITFRSEKFSYEKYKDLYEKIRRLKNSRILRPLKVIKNRVDVIRRRRS